jgi:hypothetical protein
MKPWLWIALCAMLLSPAALAPGCSLQNQEGPDVSCAVLECGRVNACKDGIIAQCLDRKTVIFHVCASSGEDICDEDWQIPGQYRCLETETDCEGCRPERADGCGLPSGDGGGGATSASSSGGSGGAGGSTGGSGGSTGGSGGSTGGSTGGMSAGGAGGG